MQEGAGLQETRGSLFRCRRTLKKTASGFWGLRRKNCSAELCFDQAKLGLRKTPVALCGRKWSGAMVPRETRPEIHRTARRHISAALAQSPGKKSALRVNLGRMQLIAKGGRYTTMFWFDVNRRSLPLSTASYDLRSCCRRYNTKGVERAALSLGLMRPHAAFDPFAP